MAEQAFTIGRITTYDELLADGQPHWKLGQIDRETGARRRVDDAGNKIVDEGGVPYLGGWVWRRAASAKAFMHSNSWFKTWKVEEFAVYEMELTGTWQTDVTSAADASDGVHRLIHDARLIRRVDV